MNSKICNEKTMDLAKEIHKNLTIDNFSWHKSKNDPDKRAAELISSALSQLLNGGSIKDIVELLNQSKLWLNREIKDPGCPKK
tara:strand:- start:440 stop:688 length:249 start_codon:yes stop_codon:yes gene_type:complete